MKNSKYFPNIIQSLGLIVMYLCFQGIIPLTLKPFSIEASFGIVAFFSTLLSGILTVFIGNYLKKRNVNSSDSLEPKFPLSIAFCILSGLAIIGLQQFIVMPIAIQLPIPEIMKEALEKVMMEKDLWMFLTAVILAPIFEELVFRGLILDGLLKKYSPALAIGISALLFGLIHGNPPQIFTGIVLGSFIGWIYYKTKRIELAVFLHFVNNASVMLYSYNQKFDFDMTFMDFYGSSSNAIIIIGSAALIFGLSTYFLITKYFSKNAPFTPVLKTN